MLTVIFVIYSYRCGNSFCATHRYAEAHSCSYDYKSEGRKIIEQNNPVVAAPKLPKIWSFPLDASNVLFYKMNIFVNNLNLPKCWGIILLVDKIVASLSEIEFLPLWQFCLFEVLGNYWPKCHFFVTKWPILILFRFSTLSTCKGIVLVCPIGWFFFESWCCAN